MWNSSGRYFVSRISSQLWEEKKSEREENAFARTWWHVSMTRFENDSRTCRLHYILLEFDLSFALSRGNGDGFKAENTRFFPPILVTFLCYWLSGFLFLLLSLCHERCRYWCIVKETKRRKRWFSSTIYHARRKSRSRYIIVGTFTASKARYTSLIVMTFGKCTTSKLRHFT